MYINKVGEKGQGTAVCEIPIFSRFLIGGRR